MTVSDITTSYTLSSSGGSITMNAGTLGDGTDKYWLTSGPKGLRAILRTPWDPVAFGDGGNIYRTLQGPQLPVFDGMYLIESSNLQADCQELRNDMAAALENVLLGALAPNSGTLAFTPIGQGAESLTVYYFATLDDPYAENYRVQNFSFGLFSPNH